MKQVTQHGQQNSTYSSLYLSLRQICLPCGINNFGHSTEEISEYVICDTGNMVLDPVCHVTILLVMFSCLLHNLVNTKNVAKHSEQGEINCSNPVSIYILMYMQTGLGQLYI